MEALIIRQKAAMTALRTLEEDIELLKEQHDPKWYRVVRDSLIQRFEYSVDTFWKYLRVYLERQYQVQVDPVTAKSVFRLALNVGFITDAEFSVFVSMIDARNLSSHAYNEQLAESICRQIPTYFQAIKGVLERSSVMSALE